MRREATIVDAFATVLSIAASVVAFFCGAVAFFSAAELVAAAFVGGATALAVWGGLRLVALVDERA